MEINYFVFPKDYSSDKEQSLLFKTSTLKRKRKCKTVAANENCDLRALIIYNVLFRCRFKKKFFALFSNEKKYNILGAFVAFRPLFVRPASLSRALFKS